jgi:hypothetical protein
MVSTPTHVMGIEPAWPEEGRFFPLRNGRLRKTCKTGSKRGANWQQELLYRSVKQNNENLLPTPELCEDFMGFPRGWTDVGATGAEDAAYAEALRKTRGPRFHQKRLAALGNAAVPQIPMLLGEFVRLCESGAGLGIGDGTPQSQEDSMSDDFPPPEECGHKNNGQPPMVAIADAPPARPQRNGSSDAAVVADAEAYLRSYLSFPDGTYYLPLALFAALEHCWDECFDEVPYLSVGAAVKAAGKTRVLELLGFLAGEEKAVLLDGSVTEAALYTEIAQGKTLLIDESERLRTPRSPLRPTLNGGYRRGQSVCRKVGRQNVKFSTFCPKVFSHLGDVYDSLRDRCIVVRMQRAMEGNRKEYFRAVVQEEGSAIARRLHEAVSARLDEIRSAYRDGQGLHRRLGFLRDRDREIWKPLFSLCQALAPSRMPELERSAADIAALKTVPARPFEALAVEEKESEEMEYAEKLLADAIVAMGGNEKMATGGLARRLRGLPTSPWRTYRGGGITPDASGAMTMASLLKRFGVEPRTIRLRPKTEPNSTAKGYVLADLVAAAGRAGLRPIGGTGRNPVTPATAASLTQEEAVRAGYGLDGALQAA